MLDHQKEEGSVPLCLVLLQHREKLNFEKLHLGEESISNTIRSDGIGNCGWPEMVKVLDDMGVSIVQFAFRLCRPEGEGKVICELR